MGHKDLRLGKIVYILVFYNISFFWLLPLDGFQFNFWLYDSENDLYFDNKKLFGAPQRFKTSISCIKQLKTHRE